MKNLIDEAQLLATEEIEKASYELYLEKQGTIARLVIRGDGQSNVNAENTRVFLKENGITHSLDIATLKTLVSRCSEQMKLFSENAVVAKGKLPMQGVDGSIELLIKQDTQVKIDAEGKADFRNVAKYHSVSATQVLAKRTPAVLGKVGTDVFGQILEPQPVNDPQLVCGDHVKYDSNDNTYRAIINGIYVQNDSFIDVCPELKIVGSVGLETGNLVFDESIHIEGNIERGSTVHSKGDLKVGGLIESGNVRALQNLTASIGINTDKEGTVFSEGDLKAGYIENAKVLAIGDIEVEKSIISSHIIGCSNIYLPSRSSVVSSSEILCFGSLTCGSLGNQNETTTTIQLGLHFRNQKIAEKQVLEIRKVKAALKSITIKVGQIKSIVERATKPLSDEKKKEYKQIFESYKETSKQLDILSFNYEKTKHHLYNNEPVFLRVSKTIYPGVVLYYRDHIEEIKSPLKHCRVKFSPDKQAPTILPYE